MEILCLIINSAKYLGSRILSVLGNTNVPPAEKQPNKSYTARSKDRFDNPKNISLSLTAYVSLTSAIVFDVARWVMITPLGSPVVPDVNIIYAGLS